MSEKQCVRCGRAGHDSAECKWLSADSVNKPPLDVLAQLDLAETEVINAKAWSVGGGHAHCDFALTAIAMARQAISAAEQAQQAEPVAVVQQYANGTKSISWSDRRIHDLPDGTLLYAAQPPAADQQLELERGTLLAETERKQQLHAQVDTLLDALSEATRLIAEISIAATGCEVTEERIDKVVRIAREGSAVQRFRDMIAEMKGGV